MSALDTPHTIEVEIDKIEAFGNAELDYDTRDTVDFLKNPRDGVELRTPNGSKIRITHKGKVEILNGEEIRIVRAKVLKAPRCPQYVGFNVKIGIDLDGAINILP